MALRSTRATPSAKPTTTVRPLGSRDLGIHRNTVAGWLCLAVNLHTHQHVNTHNHPIHPIERITFNTEHNTSFTQ